MIKSLLFLFLFAFILTSCKVLDPEETIPSFIRIESVGFDAGAGQGSDSVTINDVWVYVDDEIVGAFELPATVPILKSGQHKITLRFGVILNGIAATRSINPFFEAYTTQVNLIEDSIITLHPNSSYVASSVFFWNETGQEGFEDGGISIDSINGSDNAILKSDTVVYEGNYSGWIKLTKDLPDFLGASTKTFNIPSSGSKSMLMEMHCKNTNNNLGLGIYVKTATGITIKVDYLIIKPGPNWKKIYVNMPNLLDTYLTASTYQVFFSASLESGNQTANIYLDNIKLISF